MTQTREEIERRLESFDDWSRSDMEDKANGAFFCGWAVETIRQLLDQTAPPAVREGGYLDEVVKFLCGQGPLNGVWFGEKPEGETGNFWWRKHLRKALNTRANIPSQEWRPIEEAPKDGTNVLLFNPAKGTTPFRVREAKWCVTKSGGSTWRLSSGPFWAHNEPTHWMPLPPPPEGE
ncbi:MAG: DUF551 domain-containing protein [Pseudomonadota bacterium]|nr:DUF551 domain-containing protein [Pseudomonadota bacterium]